MPRATRPGTASSPGSPADGRCRRDGTPARTAPSRRRSTSRRPGSARGTGCSPLRTGPPRRDSGNRGSSSRPGTPPGIRCCTGARTRRRAGRGIPEGGRSPRSRTCLSLGSGPGRTRAGHDAEGRGRWSESTIRAAGAAKRQALAGGRRTEREPKLQDGPSELTTAPVAATLTTGRRKAGSASEEESGILTASEVAFLALGLVLGVATGAALIEVLRARPPVTRQIRVTVAPNAIQGRRAATLAETTAVGDPVAPAEAGPGDRRWLESDGAVSAAASPGRRLEDRDGTVEIADQRVAEPGTPVRSATAGTPPVPAA